MASNTYISVVGAPELAAWLTKVAPDAAVKALKSGVEKEARRLRGLARDAAPVSSGRLRKAIMAKGARDDARSATVVGGVYVRRGKSRKDPNGAYYWRMIEFGTVKQPSQPFIRPALARAKAGFASSISSTVMQRIKATIKRSAKP